MSNKNMSEMDDVQQEIIELEQKRINARKIRDYDEADRIRDDLKSRFGTITKDADNRPIVVAPPVAVKATEKRVKLTGYEWYRSIGSPKKIVAPMVDQSDMPFRLLCRRHGADVCYTQMLNCPIFLTQPQYRVDNMGAPGDGKEKPLIVQIAGHVPAEMLKVGLMVQDDCDAVDVNLGCPQGIAKRGHYGAYLMEELDLLTDIVSTLANGLDVPVTCKTRIYHGDDGFERSIRLAETLVKAGASLLTIHGRTREEKGQWTGAADWEMIRRIKAHFGDRVPIIANGGIADMEDVEGCLAFTGCDGIMSSEGVLEWPALFNRGMDSHGRALNQIDLAEEYLDLADVHGTRNPKIPRAHIMKMLYRYFNHFHDLRDKCQMSYTLDEFRAVVRGVKERVEAAGAEAGKTPAEAHAEYAGRGNTWYTRHFTPGEEEDTGRTMGMQREVMMAEQQTKLAAEAWALFEADGEEEGDDWGGIFAGLGM
jgi:tRNA-dihydrouridine synthase 1